MDLGQDWGALNRILYPRKKVKGTSTSDQVFIAHHADRALRIVGDRDEFFFATGALVGEALNAVGSEHKTVAIDVAEMDRALFECLKTEGGIYDQIAVLRNSLSPSKGKLPPHTEHFLVEAIRTWWGKFFPSSFGIYLHLEENASQEARGAGLGSSLLLIFRKGELREFDTPDFSSISAERRADLSEKVKVLRERYGVPVQGFAMNHADFLEWTELASNGRDERAAWKKIAKALRQDRLQLVPFRISLAALIGTRGTL